MSGQPYRYASDPARFRNDYMKTLGLRVDIDELNLDANKTYKSTGQLPAVSQMSETRTTSEILADREKVRMSLMEDLKPLGSAIFASDIIQTIERSPLNLDGALFNFFAQRAPEIVRNIKAQFKYGIAGNKNDVYEFVLSVEDMFNKTKSFSSSVKSYFSRPSDTSLTSGVITFGDLESIKSLFTEVSRKLLLVYSPDRTRTPLDESIRQIVNDLNILSQSLSNASYIENTKTFIDSQIARMGGAGDDVLYDFYDLYKRYNELLENFPKSSTLLALIGQLEESSKNRSATLSMDLLQHIKSQLSTALELRQINEQLNRLKPQVNNLLQPIQQQEQIEQQELVESSGDIKKLTVTLNRKKGTIAKNEGELVQLMKKDTSGMNEKESKKHETAIRAKEANIDKHKSQLADIQKQIDNLRGVTKPSDRKQILEERGRELENLLTYGGLSEEEYQKYNNEWFDIQDELDSLNKKTEEQKGEQDVGLEEKTEEQKGEQDVGLEEKTGELDIKKLKNTRQKLRDNQISMTLQAQQDDLLQNPEFIKVDEEITRVIQKIDEEIMRKEASGTEGNGMYRKPRGRPKGSGIAPRNRITFKDSFLAHRDENSGVEESPRYVRFGKFYVNAQKLNGSGILSLRRPSGANIQEMPSTRVSSNLSHVIKKMIGGGVPSYAELSKLSEPEKSYLHKISTKANIVDKFSIPAPDKDRMEKDIHDFEVMKGEILAGNDSSELIKKFKLHLVRLSKTGTLPRSEVQDIMEELIQLGY